jgi:hypothetical protein
VPPEPPLQIPPLQVCPPEQAWPHEPQFALLVLVSMQVDPHIICPATGQEHVPPWQVVPPVQL